MTDYYCDLEANFVDRSGADGTTNVLTGPGGLQAAIRDGGASGLATALVAGDTLYVKNTASLSRLVKMDCGNDVSHWAVGDVVKNHTGGGASEGQHWAGVVVQEYDEIATGLASANILLVQLTTDFDYADVDANLAAGIRNLTQAEDFTPVSDVTCVGIELAAAGDTTAGYISFVATDDAWDEVEGTQAVLDGEGVAAHGISYTVSNNYTRLKGITVQNATGDGIYRNGSQPEGWFVENCIFDSNGGDGVGDYLSYCTFIKCRMTNNTANGMSNIYHDAKLLFCVLRDNVIGLGTTSTYSGICVIGCDIDNNSGVQCHVGGGWLLLNNVIDGEDDTTSGHGVDVLGSGNIIISHRITHNDGGGQYGIVCTLAACAAYEDYNAFFDNTNDKDTGMIGGSHDDDTLTDDGYVDRGNSDFNVATGKELRSVAIDLDWDA